MEVYRVITRAYVERIYEVQAPSEKQALIVATFKSPLSETDIEEETIRVELLPPPPAANTGDTPMTVTPDIL